MGNSCTLVTSIESLESGDHIAYKTGLFHYQHAIVVSVNSLKEITVIRFRQTVTHSGAASPRVHTHVREEELNVSDYILRQKIYRYNYRFYDSFLPGAVVDRARRGALGFDAQRFCYWCKTGRTVSPRACVVMTSLFLLLLVCMLILWLTCKWCCWAAASDSADDEL